MGEDEIMRGLERLLGLNQLTPEQFERLRRLREVERLTRELGGKRRALQHLYNQGRGISREELKALQTFRNQMVQLLRNLKANPDAARLARLMERSGRALGLLRFVNPALLGGLALVLVLALAISLFLYRQKSAALKFAQRSGPYCDCTRVSAGLLTKEYQEQCRDREALLVKATANCSSKECIRTALKLKTGPDEKLVSGEFCDSVTEGPFAWPIEGGPIEPPPRPVEEKECKSVSGISRECD